MRKVFCMLTALVCALSVCLSACTTGTTTIVKEDSDQEFDFSNKNEFPLEDLTDATQSYESALGGLMGNDKVGYTMLGRSVMTTVDDTIIPADRNFEVSFNLKISKHSNNLGFRVGINSSLGTNNNIITGYCMTLAYQQDSGKIQLFGENISNWAKITERYDVAERLAVFDWDRTYALKFRWVGNEITIYLDGEEVARGSNSVDRTTAPSKLYFWNVQSSNAKVSNIVISDVASFKANSGEVTGDDSLGYTMNGKSIMSLAENTQIAPEEDYEISMKAKFDSASAVDFRVLVNAAESAGAMTKGYALTMAGSESGSVELFGENVADQTAITGDSKHTVSADLASFDWEKTYELKLTWIGNVLSLYLDGEKVASGSSGVNRSVDPSTLYIWNNADGAVVHVSNIVVSTVNTFEKMFGTVSGNDKTGYAIRANSAIAQVTGRKIYDSQIDLAFSVAAKGWPNFRIMIGGEANAAGNGFASETANSGICLGITSDGKNVSFSIQSRKDWQSYYSAVLCTYEEFKFDTDYAMQIKIADGKNISVKLGKIVATVTLDDDELIPADAALHFWNPGVQTTTVKNVSIAEREPEPEPEVSFEKAFGAVAGNDETGYALKKDSAISEITASSLYDVEIGFDFSVAAKGWPNFRIMLGGEINAGGNGFASGTANSGICVGITSDGTNVSLSIQSRKDWHGYGSATLCTYADFKFDTDYTLQIKIKDGKNLSVKLGDVEKEVVLRDEELISSASKLYFWNPGAQTTTVKNISILENPELNFEKMFGTVTGDNETGYVIGKTSGIGQIGGKKICDSQIDFDFSIAAKGYQNLRVLLGGELNSAGSGFASGTVNSGISVDVKFDNGNVVFMIQSRNGWKTYYSAVLCTYDEFKFDTDYKMTIKVTDGKNLTVKLGDIETTVVLDDAHVISANAKLHFWNPGDQATTIKNISITDNAE